MPLGKAGNVKLLATGLAAVFLCVTTITNSSLGQRKIPPAPSELSSGELSRNPPEVESISVKLLAKQSPEGNALLKVRYARNERERIGRQVQIQLEKRRVILRDDGRGGDERAGDGFYSAIVDFDLKEFDRQQQRLLQETKEKGRPTVPVFKGRERVGNQRVPMIDVRRLKAGQEFQILPILGPGNIDSERSLMITSLSVVKDPARTWDPCGGGTKMSKWSFGRLMKEMANTPKTGVNPNTFVQAWMGQWASNQTINGFVVPHRAVGIGQLFAFWQLLNLPNPILDISNAPFRLVAIVNRVDLRNNSVYGGAATDAGEVRFIFGALGPNCQALPFTVIFEYGVPKKGCGAIQIWGKEWANLSTLPLPSSAYNAALESLTDQVTLANANPNNPNGSALNQLRTNEEALATSWELREFAITASHQLKEITVAQTPDFALNNSSTLASYINLNKAGILQTSYTVPLTFPGSAPFRGGGAPTPSPFTHWNAPGITNMNARHAFSLNTCSGCHAGETATNFVHVDPLISPAGLSGFLTGETIPDIVAGWASPHQFEDLLRRADDLNTLANSPCLFKIAFQPLKMVH